MSKTGDLQRSCRDPREDVWENRRGTESGKFLVVIRGGLASGIAGQNGEPGGITLAGSANGNSVSLSWSWTEGVGGQGLATGTINGQSIGGTWSNTDGQSGSWSGSGC